MKNKLILFLFFLLLVIPLSLAAKEAQTPSGTDILDIEIPHRDFVMLGETRFPHIHVWNATNGMPMDNTTVDCWVDLYNQTGNHILQHEFMEFDPPYDWEIVLNGSNIATIGEYPYVISCNASGTGGFVSSAVIVTETGRETQNNLLAIVLGLITIIIFFTLLAYYTEKLGLKIVGYAVALAELINLTFMLWLKESAYSLLSMLRINFWITLIIIFGIISIALIFLFMRFLNLDDSMENEDKKWQDPK